jgi:hypothetical protein
MNTQPISETLSERFVTIQSISNHESSQSIHQELRTTSFRSSMRRLKAEMGSSIQIQKKDDYLMLEEAADVDFAKGFHSDWVDQYGNEYREYQFYQEIANRYATAASKAIELSKFSDAARIMEKEALIFDERLGNHHYAIDRLLQAWQLCNQAGDRDYANSILQKLHTLTDSLIAIERADKGPLRLHYLIGALLHKAEILEITNSEQSIEPFYEEAGQLCMTLFALGEAYRHSNPALIAGLCFEKSKRTKEHAQIAYEKAIKFSEKQFAFIDDELEITEESDLTDAEKNYVKWCKLIFSAPVYLETSLACLKCGKKDLFAALLHRQVKEFISFGQEALSQMETADDGLFDYIKALASIGSGVLGSETSEMLEIKKAMKEFAPLAQFDCEEPSFQRQKIEAALFALFTPAPGTSVKSLIKLLEDGPFIRP